MRRPRIAAFTLCLAIGGIVLVGESTLPAQAFAHAASVPGGPLTSLNTTPFPSSSIIVGARWTSPRYASPANQSGDILPTVWSRDGGTYVMMDDGGVDVPVAGELWRQSLARVNGRPPSLYFRHVGDPASPSPRTWAEIGTDRGNDRGPLGPYYSSGFAEVHGVFYATQERNWNWLANGLYTGLVGIAYSKDHGETWHSVRKSFDAPLGNLAFVDSGVPGGAYPDGYLYAIGSPREFNASSLVLGRVRPDLEDITDPARWQWYAGVQTAPDGQRSVRWSTTLGSAATLLRWASHITYPQMTYDKPLHRYLLTFTYSYSSQPPAEWTAGGELVILEAPAPSGPFSFVAQSSYFGRSNGYGAGFPSQWISRDGRDLWLKWAANFAGCDKGLDCSGKYGFNLAELHLTTRAEPTPPAAPSATVVRARGSWHRAGQGAAAVLSDASPPLIFAFATPLLLVLAVGRRRRVKARAAVRRRSVGDLLLDRDRQTPP